MNYRHFLVVAALCGMPLTATADAKRTAGKNGRIAGKPFTALSAIMRASAADGIPESKFIDVYTTKVTCDKPFDGKEGDPVLDVAITVKGRSAKADGEYVLFETLQKSGLLSGPAAKTGAVVLNVGKPSTLKLDAKADDDNFVTGSITVVECP